MSIDLTFLEAANATSVCRVAFSSAAASSATGQRSDCRLTAVRFWVAFLCALDVFLLSAGLLPQPVTLARCEWGVRVRERLLLPGNRPMGPKPN